MPASTQSQKPKTRGGTTRNTPPAPKCKHGALSASENPKKKQAKEDIEYDDNDSKGRGKGKGNQRKGGKEEKKGQKGKGKNRWVAALSLPFCLHWLNFRKTSAMRPSEKCLEWHCVKLSKLKLFPCSQKRGNNFKHFRVLFINCRHLRLGIWAQGMETADKWGVLQVRELWLLSLPRTIDAPPHQFFATSATSLHPPSPYVSYHCKLPVPCIANSWSLINIQQLEQMTWFRVAWVLVRLLGLPQDKILTALSRGLSFAFEHILTSRRWVQRGPLKLWDLFDPTCTYLF